MSERKALESTIRRRSRASSSWSNN